MNCPECGQICDSDARFCEGCGATLQAGSGVQTTEVDYSQRPQPGPGMIPCPVCGNKNDLDSAFCESCGNTLSRMGTGVPGAPGRYPKIPVARQPRQSSLDFSAVDSRVYLPLGISVCGALLLLISLALPWQQLNLGGYMKINVGAHYGWLCLLSAFGSIALAVGALLSRASGGSFDFPFPEGYIFMGLGGFSMLIGLMRMLIRESPLSVGSGSIVALVASMIIIASGFLWLRN